MGLRIVVTVKQVPDTHNISGEAMKPDGTVNRAALPAIFNPEDLHALEEAIRIREAVGGTVTCLTMGPPRAVEVLRDCIFRGADDGVLISDRRFAGADTLATSYALKCAVQKIGQVDLVLCGRQAIDGDTAQVGPQLAEKLGVNQITSVAKVVEVNDQAITCRRDTEYGAQVVRSAFPVLLTINAEANEPRSPSAKRVMAYKNLGCTKDADDYDEVYLGGGPDRRTAATIKEWNLEAIAAEESSCGFAGSPTKVKGIESVVLTAGETRKVPNTLDGIRDLMDQLRKDHIIG